MSTAGFGQAAWSPCKSYEKFILNVFYRDESGGYRHSFAGDGSLSHPSSSSDNNLGPLILCSHGGPAHRHHRGQRPPGQPAEGRPGRRGRGRVPGQQPGAPPQEGAHRVRPEFLARRAWAVLPGIVARWLWPDFKIVCVWPFGLLDYGSATLRCKI